MKLSLLLASFLLSFPLAAHADLDWPQIEAQLKGAGLTGRIHGSVGERSLFVFTIRDPADFFSHYEFPLVASTPEIESKLSTLARHDRVILKGHFLVSRAPIRHILVEGATLDEKYESPIPAYSYRAKIPDELKGRAEAVFRVHAIVAEGKAVVLEYKDAVIPVFFRSAAETSTLFRGDRIRLRYVLRDHPPSPTHLAPDPSAEKAFEILSSVRSRHGQTAALEGSLVLFPRSPQIVFDVFALQEIAPEGTTLEYTLVNFENPELFKKIREKLSLGWNRAASSAESGRNKLVNPLIRVHAQGVLNVVDANQANPQILLSSPDDVTLEFLTP